MSVLKKYNQHRYIAAIEATIEQAGLKVSIGTDFEEYRDFRILQTDRGPLPPMFDPTYSYIYDTRAFWVKCSNANNEIVHTHAVRLFDLSHTTLADHIHKFSLIYAPPEIERSERSEISFEAPAVAKIISGQVAYHGEAWTAPSLRTYRNGMLSVLFGRFGLVIAAMAWPLNYSFAFMSQSNTLRGYAARSGFLHLEQNSWFGSEDGESIDEFFLWMSCEDIERMMGFSPQKLNIKAPAKPKNQPSFV